MRHVTIYTTDNEYNHFLELVRNLFYVKKIETDGNSVALSVEENIRKGFEEMALIKKGKLKTTPLQDFLNDL